MSSIYHILDKLPPIEKYDLTIGEEQLAKALVDSGLLRIDAGNKTNFVRYNFNKGDIHLMFSYRELHDKKLLPITIKILSRHLSSFFSSNDLTNKINSELEKLRQEFKKYIRPSYEQELILARLLVRSAEPIVITMILLERTQVFVSFSHQVGDVMDIQSWQMAGENSGLQSQQGQNTAIYVSCGGDPFTSPELSNYHYDGYNAQARLMIIAAQEIGHFSDIIRNKNGLLVDRHSCNIYLTKAKDNVRLARKHDLTFLKTLEKKLSETVFYTLVEEERHYRFYKKHKKFISMLNCYRRINKLNRTFLKQCDEIGYSFAKVMNKKKFAASLIAKAIPDMRFNLAPEADVYKNSNKEIEEAIMCAEALARVPQQVVKWGHSLTRFMMPELYQIYYINVIPKIISSYETIYNCKFSFESGKIRRNIIKKIISTIRKAKYKFKPVEFDQ